MVPQINGSWNRMPTRVLDMNWALKICTTLRNWDFGPPAEDALSAGRDQAGAQLDPAALLVRALAGIHARINEKCTRVAGVWFTTASGIPLQHQIWLNGLHCWSPARKQNRKRQNNMKVNIVSSATNYFSLSISREPHKLYHLLVR
jgi:DNA-directed RNA polymerase subunit L